MRIAEALILRADAQKRMEQVKQRLLRNAKVQEGEEPAEDPKMLIREMEHISDELTSLIQRINRTNSATELEPGTSISDALAMRDIIKQKHHAYNALAQEATVTQARYSKSELKFYGTVDVAAIQKQANELARTHRELDTRIQEANWLVDLLEQEKSLTVDDGQQVAAHLAEVSTTHVRLGYADTAHVKGLSVN